VVKRTADPFTTVSGVREYDLDTGVAEVMRVWCDTNEITGTEEDDMVAWGFTSSIPGQTNTPSTPSFFVQTDPGVIALFPTPDKAYTINMRVAIRPSRSDTQVEDQLFEDWVESIVDGALMRLYVMPGAWSNPALSKLHGVQYEVGINAAMLEARRGAMRSQSRVTPVHI
jgi:hypothetical protein